MRRIKITLATLGTIIALGVLSPGALAQGKSADAPGQNCDNPGTTQNNAEWAHSEGPANLGQSTEHMGSGSNPVEEPGDGGMMKGQPWCGGMMM